MESDIIFKKVRFGGFDRKDVMNYIAKITNEFQDYNKKTVKTIDELLEKIKELEKANSSIKDEYDKAIRELSELKNTTPKSDGDRDDIITMTSEIKSIVESLFESMNEFMSSLHSKDVVTGEDISEDGSEIEEKEVCDTEESEDNLQVSADEVNSDIPENDEVSQEKIVSDDEELQRLINKYLNEV